MCLQELDKSLHIFKTGYVVRNIYKNEHGKEELCSLYQGNGDRHLTRTWLDEKEFRSSRQHKDELFEIFTLFGNYYAGWHVFRYKEDANAFRSQSGFQHTAKIFKVMCKLHRAMGYQRIREKYCHEAIAHAGRAITGVFKYIFIYKTPLN